MAAESAALSCCWRVKPQVFSGRKVYVTCNNVPKFVALGKEDLDVDKQKPYGILAR